MKYVKLINETTVEDAPQNYTTEDGATICNFNLAPEIMLQYGYKELIIAKRDSSKEYTISYKENETTIEEVLEEIVPDPEEEARKERERLDKLTLTPSDVERALYYGLGMDFDDLKAMIAEKAPTVDIKAIGIEFRANNFYRGALDKNKSRIVDMIGVLLGLTTDELDYLFEHKELPQEAIDRLRPQPESTICFECGNDPCTCDTEPKQDEPINENLENNEGSDEDPNIEEVEMK